MLRVQTGLCQDDWVLFGLNLQFIDQCVAPNSFHVFPVSYDAVVYWVAQVQVSMALGVLADVNVLGRRFRSAHGSWENGPRRLIASKARFD